MPRGVEIVEASKADVEALSALAIRTYVAAFGKGFKPGELDYYLDQKLTAKRWREYLRRDHVLLAQIDGRSVGYIQFGPEENREGVDIRRLYVDTGHQGRGIGTALLETVLGLPEVSAAPAVYIDTWTENSGARRLYERFGFVHEGEMKPFVLSTGEIDGYDIVMVRHPSLNAPSTTTT
jgi:ribosomal protein S18 acetylase RimI-like enzyme